jgi:hypothetical protein
MGTSLSGLTPATTFDGLLKTSDNDGLSTTKKTIGTGDGNDSQLKLATNSTQMGNIEFVSGNVIATVSPSTNLRIVSGGVGINGDYSSPAANTRLHIKGSGSTSATTSLLVQNSAGDDSLKITDDNKVLIGNSTTGGIHNVDSASSLPLTVSRLGTVRFSVSSDSGNGQIVLKSNTNNEFSVGTNGNIFQINDGANTNQGSKRFSIIQDGNIGIGDVGPTAKLHVKGSGADDTTTSLLVQNSDGTQLFAVRDDGRLLFGTSSNLMYLDGSVLQTWQINNSYFSGSRVGIGVNPSGSYRLHVKGSGNDNTTTSLLVQNSDGTELMKVQDDGATTLNSSAANALIIDSTIGTSGFEMQAQGQQKFRIQASGSTTRFTTNNTGGLAFLGNGIFTGGAFDIPAARLQVKGSGATSATTALLVENSAGTELLKVRDDGWVDLPGVLNGSAIRANTLQVDSVNFKVDGTNNYFQSQFSKNIFGADNANAEASAVLQADSTTQGFLPPRMAEGERDAISSPAAGLMVYNTDANQMNYWNGSTWIAF